jgi:hypothetical protein
MLNVIICLLKFPALFNNGVRTYGEYLLKGEALHEVFILLVKLGCSPINLNELYIAIEKFS